MRLQCIGAATMDTILSVRDPLIPGHKVLAKDCVQIGAGMASSAAVAAARLGAEAGIWSRIGDDANGRQYLADLSAEGVNVSDVRIVPGGSTGIGIIMVEEDGERLIVPWYDPDLNQDPGWLPLENLARTDALLADVRWPTGSAVALGAAQAAGIPAILDGDTSNPETLTDLAARSTHAIFSEGGLQQMTGIDAVDDALLEAQEICPGIVGVTLGAKGFRWLEDSAFHQVATPTVKVVDTLSAGDVFHGAFAVAIGEGQTVRDAGEFACVAAAIKCTRFGGRAGAPTRDEVETLLAQ